MCPRAVLHIWGRTFDGYFDHGFVVLEYNDSAGPLALGRTAWNVVNTQEDVPCVFLNGFLGSH